MEDAKVWSLKDCREHFLFTTTCPARIDSILIPSHIVGLFKKLFILPLEIDIDNLRVNVFYDEEEKKYFINFGVNLPAAYKKHADLASCLKFSRFQESSELGIEHLDELKEPCIYFHLSFDVLENSIIQRVLLDTLTFLLHPHDNETCPSLLCHRRNFCSNCDLPWRLSRLESRCYVCKRRYCFNCDSLLLPRNRKQVLCTNILDKKHVESIKSCSSKSRSLFHKSWQKELNFLLPSVLSDLVLSYMFILEIP